MIHFKLSLLSTTVSNNRLTNVKYSVLPISEFYDQNYIYQHNKRSAENKSFSTQKHSFSYTYDEKLSLHQNAQKELTFSMSNKIHNQDTWEDNPFINYLHNGSLLLLEDNFDRQMIFIIKDIKYSFGENSIIYNITCQDAFTYQLSTQNDGYTITNDSSNDDFIGARTIDWWIYKKIKPECHIAYNYLLMPQGLYKTAQDELKVFSGETPKDCAQLIKKPYPDDIKDVNGNVITHNYGEYYETIVFSCSGASADSALISLVEQLDLQIITYEYYNNGILYKYFWVEPKKNEERPCLTYSPFSNIQDFSLTHSGSSLSTVLNVNSNTYADELVSLLPEVPNFFYDYFQSTSWISSNYHIGMFNDLLKGTSLTVSNYRAGDITLLENTINDKTNIIYNAKNKEIRIKLAADPELNKLYNYLSFVDSDNTLHNSIRIQYSVQNEIHEATISTLNTSFGLLYDGGGDLQYRLEEDKPLFYDKILALKNYILYLCIPWFIEVENDSLSLVSYDFPIRFYKEITIEEQNFADIADKCPWLENKLINFDYFLDHNLFTKSEYTVFMDKLNNELRITNGQLLSYTKSYYEAIKQKANIIADLNNSFDSLGAAWNSDINTVIEEKGQLPDITNQYNQSNPTQYFDNAYNAVFSVKPQVPTYLLNRDGLITEYFNKYFLAQQRFLKNIRTFKNYFESPVDTHLKGLYTTEMNIPNTTGDNSWYTFAEVSAGGFQRLQPNSKLTDEEDKAAEKEKLLATKEDIFYNNEGNMLKCDYVKEDNFSQFVVPNIKEGSYTVIDDSNKETKYSDKKLYYKRIITFTCEDLNHFDTSKTYDAKCLTYEFTLRAKIENETIKWQLIPKKWQSLYLNFFNSLSKTLTILVGNGSYKTSDYAIDYEQVSILDIVNDWCWRHHQHQTWDDIAEPIVKNWYVPKSDYKYYINSYALSFENFVKINDRDDFDFDTTVKPTFYIKSPIYNFIQTTSGLQAERVNEYGYNQEQYNKATKKGTAPNDYTAETTVNYVMPSNAETYFTTHNVWKDVLIYGGAINQLIAMGLVLNGWANASILEDGEITSLDHKIEHYISAFGWFKGYKDVNSLIYATKEDAASTWRQYSTALPKNKLYKQNFYDLFGITKTALLNLRKQNEKFYVKPSIWYQVLKPKYQIKPSDTIVWLPYYGDTNKKTRFITGQFPTPQELNNIYCNHLFQYKEDINLKVNEAMSLEEALKAQGFIISEIDAATYAKNPYITIKKEGSQEEAVGYFFRVNKQYYQPFNDTFYELGTTFYTQTAYDYITNQVIDYTTLPDLLYGFVMYSSTADQFEPATKFDLKEIYYQKIGDKYERAYTLYQLLYDKPYPIYIYKNSTLIQTEFVNDNTTYQVKLIKHTWIDQEKGTYVSEPVDDVYHINATITKLTNNLVEKVSKDKVNGITIRITTKLVENFLNINKGNFWIKYHNQINSPELFSKAAAIESELETYWNVAVNASRLCEYFIPDNWRPTSADQVNGYTKFLYKVVDGTYILTDLIPTVEILKDEKGNTSLSRYNITYNSQVQLPSIDQVENQFLVNSLYSLRQINNQVITNIVKGLGASITYWTAEEVGKTNYYYVSNGGYTYQMMLSHIAQYNGGSEYTGNYLLMLKRLMDLSYYQNYNDLLYENTLDQHNAIWDEIYRNFGNVIYERTYSNENAADSNELYELANLAFKDYMIPERNYSITIINNHELEYHGEELHIGDPIRINADEYYNIYDSLYKSLSQYLFITDISYSLRSPTDFSLTVNNIKYSDKLLKRLVKLI